ncbi:MAG: transposase [Moorea sp. SIO3G5]|nr:transposase [Moorena sp. SIO3G5]
MPKRVKTHEIRLHSSYGNFVPTDKWSTAFKGYSATGAPWRDLPERYGKWQTVATGATRGEFNN